MKTNASLLIFFSLTFLPVIYLNGSGSYNNQPTHSGPAYQSQRLENAPLVIDSERYHLGQQIYSGKLKLNSHGMTENQNRIRKQTKMLNRLKKRLPLEVAESFDVQSFAGKLNNKQFWSLKYYLDVRYVYPARS